MKTNSLDVHSRDPQGHVAYVFRRLSRTLREARGRTEAEHVHQFRTTAKRLRVLATSLGEAEEKSVARLNKTLDKLFNKAGKVRDLDVQMEALSTLSLPSAADDKAELLKILQRQREKRAKKLVDAIEEAQDDGLARRQRRAKAALSEAAEKPRHGVDVLSETRQQLVPFLQRIRDNQFTEETLHRFRLEVKELRYTAEAAGLPGTQIANALKPLQDAIGEWHDWYNLCRLAEKKLAHPAGHPILPILRAKVSAHFARAQQAMKQTYAGLSQLTPVPKRPESTNVQPIRVETAQAS